MNTLLEKDQVKAHKTAVSEQKILKNIRNSVGRIEKKCKISLTLGSGLIGVNSFPPYFNNCSCFLSKISQTFSRKLFQNF